ncbi:MAG: hypothetical protein MAG471_01148 [Acidimicrobiaceae bacterium]|nr:hypothetical protein [Acidimicrobiaceae bacterium]
MTVITPTICTEFTIQEMAPHCANLARASTSLVTRAVRTPVFVDVCSARLSRWRCANVRSRSPNSTASATPTSRL